MTRRTAAQEQAEAEGAPHALAGLRVLMLAPEPFFVPRGTPFSILNRLVSLGRHRVQVDLVTYPIGEDPELPGVRVHRGLGLPGVRRVPIGFSLRKVFLDLGLLLKALRLLRRHRYDLLHTHEEAGLVGGWLARRHGLRHLHDMHSNLVEQLRRNPFFRWGPLQWLGERWQRRTLQQADAVITICPELEEYVRAVAPQTPCMLVENTYDVFAERGPDTDAPTLRRNLRLQSEDRVILYAGTFEPYQGLDLLIRAAPLVLAEEPRAAFVLVGGTGSQVRRFEAMAQAEGVRARMRFPGTVSPERVSAFVALAEILVSPRRRGTNTPSKIYTYMRSGKPVVATALPTHTQVLTPEVAVLVPPDPEALARALLALLRDPRRARALAERARRFAAERYNPEDYHDRIYRIYRRVAPPRNGTSTT